MGQVVEMVVMVVIVVKSDKPEKGMGIYMI